MCGDVVVLYVLFAVGCRDGWDHDHAASCPSRGGPQAGLPHDPLLWGPALPHGCRGACSCRTNWCPRAPGCSSESNTPLLHPPFPRARRLKVQMLKVPCALSVQHLGWHVVSMATLSVTWRAISSHTLAATSAVTAHTETAMGTTGSLDVWTMSSMSRATAWARLRWRVPW